MDKRYVVPEGMLRAAMKPFGWNPDRYSSYTGAFFEGVSVRDIVEAVIRHISENPIVPTNEQIDSIIRMMHSSGDHYNEMRYAMTHWPGRMFLAEPEVPEEIKDLLVIVDDYPVKDTGGRDRNKAVLEAYRRGKAAKE